MIRIPRCGWIRASRPTPPIIAKPFSVACCPFKSPVNAPPPDRIGEEPPVNACGLAAELIRANVGYHAEPRPYIPHGGGASSMGVERISRAEGICTHIRVGCRDFHVLVLLVLAPRRKRGECQECGKKEPATSRGASIYLADMRNHSKT